MSKPRFGTLSATGNRLGRRESSFWFPATTWVCGAIAVAALLLASETAGFASNENPAALSPGPRTEETNSREMRTYLQLQEQIHGTQLAIERSLEENAAASQRDAKALRERLQVVEQSVSSQRARELDAMQGQNRTMLIVAGIFAAMGFVAMLLMALFQWRTINRLAEISAALHSAQALGPGTALAALGPGESHLLTAGPAGQGSLQLVGALERLEKRINELEHTAHLPVSDGAVVGNGAKPGNAPSNGEATPSGNGEAPSEAAAGDPNTAHVSMLLGKGQTMLNLDNTEGALACFEEALAAAPNSSEVLVKMGTALERLGKLDEAIQYYDRAIAADGSMTIAYLYKGGLFNRLERFTEALACYEQALRTQEKRTA
jgi:tetratricopeptide (TPR) repeat protein